MVTSMSAQPGWTSKAAKAVFTLKTFKADGSLLGSSNGFFINENGDAISSYAPFAGASRAVIIDASGKEMPVEYMIGANDMYDVAKFRVTGKKIQALTMASTTARTGAQVWMLPYTVKKPAPISGQLSKAETFQDAYAYYTVRMQMADNAVGCPLLNDNGEVIGLMQQQARVGDTLSYAISARFVADMVINGFSLNNSALKNTLIKTGLPDQQDQALLMMYMANTTLDSIGFAHMVDDYIMKFPQSEEGYINRAQLAANRNDFAAATRDMQQAISVSNPKDNAHYAYSRIIYQKEIVKHDLPFAEWNLDLAAEEAKMAYDINPMPAYRHLQAQIWFAQQKYDEALQAYQELQNTDMRGAEIYYETARCYEMKQDTTAMLALLDSAVNVHSKPYLKEAAPYLWARAIARMSAGKHRLAVQDMNEYEKLMSSAGLTAEFYYIREQAEMGGRLFQQALNDIRKATELAPREAVFFAERASVESRVGMHAEAEQSARECIRLDANSSDGYLLLGLALCQQGKKTEGLPQLQKAKELGNPQADAIIARFQ